jgi:MGT family glycosyltransferase
MDSTRRFLVATVNASGNWQPELALIRALVQRGHTVRVLADADLAAPITEAGAAYCPYPSVAPRDRTIRHNTPREGEFDRAVYATYLNPTYGDDLLTEVGRDAPDVLLVDRMLMTAAVAAEHTGLPTALLWHTVYGAWIPSPLWTGTPAAVLAPLNALRAQRGLAPVPDLRGNAEQAHAILAFTYEAFDTRLPDAPGHLHYVGPLACLPQPQPAYALPWPPADTRPLILVSYSTGFQNQGPILQRLAEAVAPLPVRVLMTLGPRIAADELRLPPNVVAEPFVPHTAVLAQTRLVVTHAGHGTVMAATTAGVPMVCTPMGRDQDAVSSCVARLGLGRVVSMTASAEELRQTLVAALEDDALYERARTFAARLDVEAGLARALAVLETLQVPGV